MTRAFARPVGLLAGVLLVVGACSSAAPSASVVPVPSAAVSGEPSVGPASVALPTAEPTAAASAQPSPLASIVPPSASPVGSSSAPASPPPGSASLEPSASEAASHAAPDLEAMLPDYFGGVQLQKASYDGSILGADAASAQLRQFLAAHGKSTKDFQEAASSDPSSAHQITFVVFRVPGVDAQALSQAVVSATVAANPDLTVSTATVDGRQVIRGDQPSGVRYLWTKDDLVFGVQAINLDLANEGLGQLK